MATFRTTHISLCLIFMLPGISFGQIKTVASGDILIYEASNATQIGNRPIEFPERNIRTLTINIEKDGSRNYSFVRDGQPYNSRDKFFTITSRGGKPIEEKERFHSFPPNQTTKEWDASFSLNSRCGNLTYTYHGMKDDGPEVTLLVDEKEVKAKTIRYQYKATPSSTECKRWDLEIKTLYSEELNEIVYYEYKNTQDYFLNEGYRWSLKSIRSSNIAK
jgi:hypothetical protein